MSLGYKQFFQYVNITLKVVLGEYVYYKRDGKCWAAPFYSYQKDSWYDSSDELIELSVKKTLEVKVGDLR